MHLVETDKLKTIEKLPGWKGKYLHTANLTIALYEFSRGAEIPEHRHSPEEVYQVQSGELEIVIDGTTHIARPGFIAVVPSEASHKVRALSDGQLVVVANPPRREFG